MDRSLYIAIEIRNSLLNAAEKMSEFTSDFDPQVREADERLVIFRQWRSSVCQEEWS